MRTSRRDEPVQGVVSSPCSPMAARGSGTATHPCTEPPRPLLWFSSARLRKDGNSEHPSHTQRDI